MVLAENRDLTATGPVRVAVGSLSSSNVQLSRAVGRLGAIDEDGRQIFAGSCLSCFRFPTTGTRLLVSKLSRSPDVTGELAF
jgi:hypothetical protein